LRRAGESLPATPRLVAFFRTSSERRIENLVELVADGYTDRVHLGHDAACFNDFMIGKPYFVDERPDYVHISTHILPALLAAGVTQAQIDEMPVTNPQRHFAPDVAAS
jgi:phosphotriesterase-related protein